MQIKKKDSYDEIAIYLDLYLTLCFDGTKLLWTLRISTECCADTTDIECQCEYPLNAVRIPRTLRASTNIH